MIIILFLIHINFINCNKTSQITQYDLKDYPNIKYCHSSMDVLEGSSVSNLRELKGDLNKNCTHVFGDVVIKYIYKSENGSEPNLEFLSSIVEITGCLSIYHTNISIIPLRNLKVIRGLDETYTKHYRFHKPYSLQIMTDTEPLSNSNETIIDLSNLRSIVNGHIHISPNYCSSLANVNWGELLEDPSKQKVVGECKTKLFNCSSTCPLVDNSRHCWGPSSKQCQIMSKCRQRPCDNRCFISSKNQEECCSPQCLGGCTSNKPNSCIACKSVLNHTECVHQCPSQYPVRFSFNNLCVKDCPKGMVEQNGKCQMKCLLKTYERKGKKCVPCGKVCDKICLETDIHSERELQKSLLSMNSEKLKKMINCTSYKGSIIIDAFSYGSTQKYPIKSVKDLYNLINLKSIEGSLYLDLPNIPFKLENLLFLENLETIMGVGKDNPNVFGLLHSPLEYLGLNSLKYINPNKNFQLYVNKDLCYIDVTKISKLFNNHKYVYSDDGKDQTKCKNEGKLCDDQCDPNLGCWGPGPKMCHKCKLKTVGKICGENCYIIPGYYNNSTSSHCLKCDPECNETCVGPKPNQCIGKCKNFKINNTCVEKCPYNSYKVKGSDICLPCHPHCHKRQTTNGPVCTGPSNQPKIGGCNKCLIIIIEGNISRCSNERPLNGSYFRNDIHIQSLGNNSVYFKYFEKYADIMATYVRCHKLCSQCTLTTAQRVYMTNNNNNPNGLYNHRQVVINWGGCIKCTRYWYNNICVNSCPKEDAYLSMDHTNTSLGNCHQCHPQCSGCRGVHNTDCIKCKNHKIFGSKNKSMFICAAQCPPQYKSVILNRKTNETECYYVLLSKLEWSIVGLTIVFITIFIGMSIIITKIYKSKTNKRRARKLRDYFSNANEADSQEYSTSTNMTYLPLISIDNLSYSMENVIGKGAFGAVYRGQWQLDDRYIEDNVSLDSCKRGYFDVAIKILNNNCNQNEFMEEIKVMASVRHKHCLRLIGVCFTSEKLLIISSFLMHGSMDRYLAKNKSLLTAEILLLWAEQIANGMLYLERNHIIHRDLATRNVLIYNVNHVQITDFGLAKITFDDEIKICTGIVPVRWLAIETLRDGIYSHKTDVWAYAVSLWEIFTFGNTPYEMIKSTEIRSEIMKGTRLYQPPICSLEIYILMLKCWNVDPDDRPNFDYLWNEFKRFCNNPKVYLSYANNDLRDSHSSEINYLEMAPGEHNNLMNNKYKIPDNLQPLLQRDPPVWNGMYQPADQKSFVYQDYSRSPSIISTPFKTSSFMHSNSVNSNNSENHISHMAPDYLEPQNTKRHQPNH